MAALTGPEVPYPMKVKPTLSQQLKVFFARGAVKAYTDNDHFTQPTAIYVFKCPEGGWILDYLHGAPPQQYLNCPSSLNGVACRGCAEAHGKQERAN